jgi:hypothetical protein
MDIVLCVEIPSRLLPRPARVAPGGLVYYVLNRSVGKMPQFAKDDDFEAVQQIVLEAHQRHPIRTASISAPGRFSAPGEG